MGDAADNMLSSMVLNDDNKKKYKPVQTKFDEHFARGRNMIYEHAKFNTTTNKMAS